MRIILGKTSATLGTQEGVFIPFFRNFYIISFMASKDKNNIKPLMFALYFLVPLLHKKRKYWEKVAKFAGAKVTPQETYPML